jgi:Flp pilus assembly protein TadB
MAHQGTPWLEAPLARTVRVTMRVKTAAAGQLTGVADLHWRDRLRDAPLLVQFGYFATGFGGLSYLIAIPGSSRSAASATIGGLLFGTWMTVRSARQRTSGRDREREEARDAVTETLRSGQPPSDPAVRGRLLRYIAEETDTLSRHRRWFPAFLAILAVVSLMAAREDRVWLVIAATYVGLFLGWLRYARNTTKELTDVERLLEGTGSRTPG